MAVPELGTAISLRDASRLHRRKAMQNHVKLT